MKKLLTTFAIGLVTVSIVNHDASVRDARNDELSEVPMEPITGQEAKEYFHRLKDKSIDIDEDQSVGIQDVELQEGGHELDSITSEGEYIPFEGEHDN